MLYHGIIVLVHKAGLENWLSDGIGYKYIEMNVKNNVDYAFIFVYNIPARRLNYEGE